MGFVESHLMPGEKIEHRASVHGVVFVPTGVFAVCAALPLLARLSDPSVGLEWGVVGAGFLIVSGLVGLAAYIRRRTSEFVVTNQRVVIKVGWLFRRSLETMLNKVESIGVEQSLSGRLFGYGTIVVRGTG